MVNHKFIIDVPEGFTLKFIDGYVIVYTDKVTHKLKLPQSIYTFIIINDQLIIEGNRYSEIITIRSIIESLFTTMAAPCKVVVTSSAMGTKFQEYQGRFYVKAGHSHFIELPGRNECEYAILNQTSIEITSAIKQEATNLAARICNIKRPDVYKAKGLYIEGIEPRVSKTIKK